MSTQDLLQMSDENWPFGSDIATCGVILTGGKSFTRTDLSNEIISFFLKLSQKARLSLGMFLEVSLVMLDEDDPPSKNLLAQLIKWFHKQYIMEEQVPLDLVASALRLAKESSKWFGIAEELVGAVLFLAGDASKFVTGTVMPIDGGFRAFSGV